MCICGDIKPILMMKQITANKTSAENMGAHLWELRSVEVIDASCSKVDGGLRCSAGAVFRAVGVVGAVDLLCVGKSDGINGVCSEWSCSTSAKSWAIFSPSIFADSTIEGN
jgi:hypothetical protein